MEASTLNSTFASGGEEELTAAVELYGQPLLRYCHNILCNYFDAQDAVQDTFIKAYNKRASFTNGSSLSAWLYRIAYTTCIDMLRRKRLFVFTTRPDPGFMNDDLKAALLSLSPPDRALVFSRVIDQKEYSELETVYNASSAALRKRYERARKKLAKLLKESHPYYSRLEGSECNTATTN